MARGDGRSERADLDPAIEREVARETAPTSAQRIALAEARAAAIAEILTAESATTRDENGLEMKTIELAEALARGYDWDSEDYAAGVRDGIAWARSLIIAKIGMAAHDSDPSRLP